MTSRLLRLCLLASATLAGGAASANDFPTVDRVLFVQECVRAHPGPYYEMLNKCSCALDSLARQLSFDEYTTMATATNANSIGGERGGYIRDTELLQTQIKRFRDAQAKAKTGCFIGAGPR